MKRYIIFAYDSYELCGGTGDIKYACNTAEELYKYMGRERKKDGTLKNYGWYEILDVWTGRKGIPHDYKNKIIMWFDVKELVDNNY